MTLLINNIEDPPNQPLLPLRFPLGDDPNGGGYDGYGNSAYHYFKDQFWPRSHFLMPMRRTFGVTVSNDGYTGPGSGSYWSDGIGFDDWNGSTGSASYRQGIDAGLHEWGGEFFTFDNEGNRINIEQSNGELLVPVTSWTEVEYSDGVTRNKNIRTEYVTLDQAREYGLISGGNSIDPDPDKMSFFEKMLVSLSLWISQFSFNFDPEKLIRNDPETYDKIQKMTQRMDNLQVVKGTPYMSINIGKQSGWLSGYGEIIITPYGPYYGFGVDITGGTSLPGIDASGGVFFGWNRSENLHNNHGPGFTAGYSFIGFESSYSGSISNPRIESLGFGISTQPVWLGVNYGVSRKFYD